MIVIESLLDLIGVIFYGVLARVFDGPIVSVINHSARADPIAGRIRLRCESADSDLGIECTEAADQKDQAQTNQRALGK